MSRYCQSIVKVWWYDATAPVSLCPPIHSPPPATPFNAMQFQPIHSNYAHHPHHPGSGANLIFTTFAVRAFRFSRKSAWEATITLDKKHFLNQGSLLSIITCQGKSGSFSSGVSDENDKSNFILGEQLIRVNLGSSQEVWQRLTEPPGRRSTRPNILGPCSKTLPPLAKEPALLASYWPRSRTGQSDWSRLWVGRIACLGVIPYSTKSQF